MNMMLADALNVGPLCFSFVPSLNDDVCGASALKHIRITHVAFKANLLGLLFNKCYRHVENGF